jgi:protein-L-isoaspartate(D-aspartate) O-methyltransferase
MWRYLDTPDDHPAHIYDDVLVALHPERHLNNGLPSSLARWIDALDLNEGDTVLHAGCGTGYYTAIIGSVVGQTGRVDAIELDSELAARARSNLVQYPWVRVRHADAAVYQCGEVDAILINAGATHPLALWLDSLKPNGRLMFPLIRWPKDGALQAPPAGLGVMMRIQLVDFGYRASVVSPVGIFPCAGVLDEEADRLLAEAFAKGGLADVRSLRRDAHRADAICLLHGDGYCFSPNYPSRT